MGGQIPHPWRQRGCRVLMVLDVGTSKTLPSLGVSRQLELLVAPEDAEHTRNGKGQCSLSTLIRVAF